MTQDPVFDTDFYASLTEAERPVVELLACLMSEYSRSRLAEILAIGKINIGGKRPESVNLKPLWQSFMNRGIIIEERGPGYCHTNASVRVLVTIALVKAGRFAAVHRLAMYAAYKTDTYLHFRSWDWDWTRYTEQWWLLLFCGTLKELVQHEEASADAAQRQRILFPGAELLDTVYLPDLLAAIPDLYIRTLTCEIMYVASHISYTQLPSPDQYLPLRVSCGIVRPSAEVAIAAEYFMAGTAQRLREVSPPESLTVVYLDAWDCFAAGRHAEAFALFQQAQQLHGKGSGKRLPSCSVLDGPAAGLLLVKHPTFGKVAALDYMKRCMKQWGFSEAVLDVFETIVRLKDGSMNPLQAQSRLSFDPYRGNPIHLVFLLVAHQFCGLFFSPDNRKLLEKIVATLNAAGSRPILAAEINAFLDWSSGNADARGPLGFCGLFCPRPQWEAALESLERIGTRMGAAAAGPVDNKQKRLLWSIFREDLYGAETISFTAFEQTRQKKGWSKGKVLSWKFLSENAASLDWLSEKDKHLCSVIRSDMPRDDWSFRTMYGVATETALERLSGHDALFWEDDSPAHIEQIPVSLSVKTSKEGSQILLTPMPVIPGKVGLQWHIEGASIFWSKYTREQIQLAEVLALQPIIPAAHKERLTSALENIAPLIPVHADLAIANAMESVVGDPRPVFLVSEEGGTFVVSVMVIPHPALAPIEPGSGRADIVSLQSDSHVRISRNLAMEKALSREAVERLVPLDAYAVDPGIWELDGRGAMLEMLALLRDAGDSVSLHWKKGKPCSISRRITGSDCRVSLAQKNDWFDISGTVALSDEKTIPLIELLKLRKESGGRFVAVDENMFMELGEELQRQLDALESSAKHMKDGVRVPRMALASLGAFFDAAAVLKGKPLVEGILAGFAEAAAYSAPLPKNCQAVLRPYQEDGFRWLASRAKAGMGCCLADDMGLGKTVEIIALLLHRSKEGPALVVAPTSLGRNWMSECARFAPSLDCILYGEGNRAEAIAAAGPNTVLVASYGLLVSDREWFAKKPFATLVCDEAQAFKNSGTLRAQALGTLTAAMRIAATGTPVENHLSELWSIFNIINPGLLGSAEQFRTRFAIPVEQHNKREASQHLRRLIAPFVMRRTKAEVLEELPEKTEIVLPVELSPEERDLYEAIRKDALSALDASGEKIAAKDRISILAQLMRLRRSCCGRSLLVDDPDDLPSKTQVLLAKIAELVENGHRALVFSQFVDHLSIVKKHCVLEGLSYQYLDGSTSPAARERAVQAFQGGEGSVFLISLKAGGTGLNLTAADYVFHMDPWWNPAVEDQASDRVHRIGQTRPVTIYRLVAQNTLEEKIVALHARKRELAEGLLAEQKGGGGMTVEDFRDLLGE